MMGVIFSKTRSRFTEAEITPSSGYPEEVSGSGMAAAIAKQLALYNAIYIQNPAHRRVFAAFDELRHMGIAARAEGQRQWGIRNTAPTGSGKTTSALAYARHVKSTTKVPDGHEPVLIVPLDRACTTRRLWTATLDALGDSYSTKGTEELLRARAYKLLLHRGVQLLIIDEVQHLSYSASERADVTDALKRVLDDAVVPLALCGTEAARPLLVRNKQLANRMLPPCDIRPLDACDKEDRKAFAGFVKRLDQAMLDAGLVKTLSGFDNPLTLACLFEVSEGVIGRVTNLVRIAYVISLRRRAEFVEICDLSAATERWAVEQGLVPHNPFRHGMVAV